MTELRLDTIEMPAGRLGPENPLPPLHAYRTVSIIETAERPREPDYPDRGNEASILPYRLQDNYDRVKQRRVFKTAILENEFLKATFLLELGGRLWSLFHKPSSRELLHVNPVFQPANLAVRDAWFSGGVEWNLSIIGHCPFTCSPLFAGKVLVADGTPILRLWEFERIRGVPFQIDFHLPSDSQFLFVRPQISNPHDHAIPMYWWSNIAVEESPGVRVLAPADNAYFHDYDRTLKSHGLPLRDGEDVTYPGRRASAADLYFRIPQERRPWIAALDAQGHGLIHASTQRLLGRKMFLWGTEPGGRRWQEYLSIPGQQYIEIQGGLATTQTEYVTMPAGAKWDWLEAYGAFDGDPRAVHSPDWHSALEHVETQLESLLPKADLHARLERWRADADAEPVEIFQTGSGWGALEDRRREKATLSPMATVGTPFGVIDVRVTANLPSENPAPSPGTPGEGWGEGLAHSLENAALTLTLSRSTGRGNQTSDAAKSDFAESDEHPWQAFIETGELPYRPPTDSPGAYMTAPPWRELLEAALAAGRGVHWLSLLHVGVMRYRANDLLGARQAWEQSLAVEPSAWVYRNLAVLTQDEGSPQRAAELWAIAARMRPDLEVIAVEACEAMLAVGDFAPLRELVAMLAPEVASAGRVRLIGTFAALRSGDLSAPQNFFATPCDIANIREGEVTLSDLWFEWHETKYAKEHGVDLNETLRRQIRQAHPLPREFDFRMKPD